MLREAAAPKFDFEPDGARAAALGAEINRRLIGSLRYVFGEVGEILGWSPVDFDIWLATLESAERLDPLIHTLFHTLVAEVEAGDWHIARGHAARLLTLGAAPPGLGIHPVDADDAGPRPVRLFGRFADLEEANRLDLIAPTPELVAGIRPPIDQALGLIRRNDPAMDEEFRALIKDLLLVSQAPEHLFTTAAVSCFQNWGGLLFNPAVQRDVLDIVELIAHECTHLLLFALALDEPLLTNPPGQMYFSPLRGTPRTMDGVYHATIVSARVARALLHQAQSPDATTEYRDVALSRARRSVDLFEDGVAIILSDDALTPLGRDVLDSASAAMGRIRANLPRETGSAAI
jgi:HEXXH motif-containing protein